MATMAHNPPDTSSAVIKDYTRYLYDIYFRAQTSDRCLIGQSLWKLCQSVAEFTQVGDHSSVLDLKEQTFVSLTQGLSEVLVELHDTLSYSVHYSRSLGSTKFIHVSKIVEFPPAHGEEVVEKLCYFAMTVDTMISAIQRVQQTEPSYFEQRRYYTSTADSKPFEALNALLENFFQGSPDARSKQPALTSFQHDPSLALRYESAQLVVQNLKFREKRAHGTLSSEQDHCFWSLRHAMYWLSMSSGKMDMTESIKPDLHLLAVTYTEAIKSAWLLSNVVQSPVFIAMNGLIHQIATLVGQKIVLRLRSYENFFSVPDYDRIVDLDFRLSMSSQRKNSAETGCPAGTRITANLHELSLCNAQNKEPQSRDIGNTSRHFRSQEESGTSMHDYLQSLRYPQSFMESPKSRTTPNELAEFPFNGVESPQQINRRTGTRSPGISSDNTPYRRQKTFEAADQYPARTSAQQPCPDCEGDQAAIWHPENPRHPLLAPEVPYFELSSHVTPIALRQDDTINLQQNRRGAEYTEESNLHDRLQSFNPEVLGATFDGLHVSNMEQEITVKDINLLEPLHGEIEIKNGEADNERGFLGIFAAQKARSRGESYVAAKVRLFRDDAAKMLHLWTSRENQRLHKCCVDLSCDEVVPLYAWDDNTEVGAEIYLRHHGEQSSLSYMFFRQLSGSTDLYGFQGALMHSDFEREYGVSTVSFVGQNPRDVQNPKIQIWTESEDAMGEVGLSGAMKGPKRNFSSSMSDKDFSVSSDDFISKVPCSKIFVYASDNIYVVLITDRVRLELVKGSSRMFGRKQVCLKIEILPDKRRGCKSVRFCMLRPSRGRSAGIPLAHNGIRYADQDGPRFEDARSVNIEFNSPNSCEDFEQLFNELSKEWKERGVYYEEFRDFQRYHNVRTRTRTILDKG